jgi:hypothetical protein
MQGGHTWNKFDFFGKVFGKRVPNNVLSRFIAGGRDC